MTGEEEGRLTLRSALRAAADRLRKAGCASPDLDARLLAEHALGLSREQLLMRADDELVPWQQERLAALVARRADREPVSRIVGRRGFWTFDLGLDASTLDPRPDTETVVEAALDWLVGRTGPLTILDLGTGTGCLLLALLSELPDATGLGLDVQEEAVARARANAVSLGLADRARFAVGDWSGGPVASEDRPFDLVVSNPPYIPDGDIAGLDPEVSRWDPWPALAGGPDGLDAYRAIAAQLPGLLVPGGKVFLEVGQGQAASVAGLLEAQGLRPLGVRCDLAGIERCVIAERPQRASDGG